MFRLPAASGVTVFSVLIFPFIVPDSRPAGCALSFAMHEQCIETEYIILQNIYTAALENQSLRQRDFARIASTSLGMTNSILKRLVKKGWITVKKLNSRTIEYAVTGEGFNEILHRGYRYFKRTIKNVAFYRDAIDQAIRGAVHVSVVALVGTSDLEFIVEHVSRKAGLAFYTSSYDGTRVPADTRLSGYALAETLLVYAEDIPAAGEPCAENSLYLSRLMLQTVPVPVR
jgi:predicted transcriptional regulator